MKILMAFVLAGLSAVSSVSQASFVNSAEHCNSSYAVSEKNIIVGVDVMEDDWTSLGYDLVGVGFGLRVKGCSKLRVDAHKNVLYCDDTVLGPLKRSQVDWQMPTWSVELDPSRDYQVIGSCADRRQPLTLIVR